MNAATAIAQHLNIAESLIAEVQEWASVLWVRFVSGRPRFVSKKVVKVEESWVRIRGLKDAVVFEQNSKQAFVIRRGYDIGNSYLVKGIPSGKDTNLRDVDFSWIDAPVVKVAVRAAGADSSTIEGRAVNAFSELQYDQV